MVEALLNALSAGDPATARHCRRVADLTDCLGEGFELGRQARATLRVAALMHDMGKIDDQFFQIVHSRNPLSAEERARIKHHPHESAYILEPLEDSHPGIMKIVASHHECWNGTGYPGGTAGDEIPLAARLISVADVFDALTQPRPYHEPMDLEQALQEIEGDAGTKFDPDVVRMVHRPDLRERWFEIARKGQRVERGAQDGKRLTRQSRKR